MSAVIDPTQWTTVIPAAGRGSRLGYDRPKILYPIAGRMILEWLIDLFAPHCRRIVVVVSGDGRDSVEEELARILPNRYAIAIQAAPTGMGDAVEKGLSLVDTPQLTVVWGDQVALRPETVTTCLSLHQQGADVTCPTVHREKPYIHFDRDDAGRISGLRQAREGDQMPPVGESDTGLFCFRTAVLALLLGKLRSADHLRGTATGEFNLLPAIPLAAGLGYTVATPNVVSAEETIGVNSREDAVLAEQYLKRIYARH